MHLKTKTIIPRFLSTFQVENFNWKLEALAMYRIMPIRKCLTELFSGKFQQFVRQWEMPRNFNSKQSVQFTEWTHRIDVINVEPNKKGSRSFLARIYWRILELLKNCLLGNVKNKSFEEPSDCLVKVLPGKIYHSPWYTKVLSFWSKVVIKRVKIFLNE